MHEPHAPITLYHSESKQLTLESLAVCTGVHATLIKHFVEYGLLEPSSRTASPWLFDPSCITRLRMIERLRRDLGANLAGIAVILDLLERLSTLLREVEQWRRRS